MIGRRMVRTVDETRKTGRLIYAPVDSNVWVSDSPDENQKPDAEYDRFEILGYGDKTEYDASTRRGLKSQLHIACAAGRLGLLRELLRIPLPEYDPDYNETKTGRHPSYRCILRKISLRNLTVSGRCRSAHT